MDEYLLITAKGRALMDLMSRGISLPELTLWYGQALYALDEGREVTSWAAKGLLREGYAMRDLLNEEADKALLLDHIRRGR